LQDVVVFGFQPSANALGPRRSANAILARAFRHLRDCDAALQLKGASPRPSLSLDFT
jgi:hypothetical protein